MPELVKFITESGTELVKDATDKPILILPISIGQAYHSGVKFVEILKQAAKHFSICYIVVADYLRRHTLLIEDDNEIQAKTKALEAGDEWIRVATEEIQKLTSDNAEFKLPIHFLRWEDILKHPSQKSNEAKLREYYSVGQDLKKQNAGELSRSVEEKKGYEVFRIINQAVGNFIGVLSRSKDQDKAEQAFDLDAATKNSRNYVIEEVAAVPNFPAIINTQLTKHPHLKDRRMYMAYPVTNSQTNRKMFECVMQLGKTQDMECLDIHLNNAALDKLARPIQSPTQSSPPRKKPASQQQFKLQPQQPQQPGGSIGFFVSSVSIDRSHSPHTLIHIMEQSLTIEQQRLQKIQQRFLLLQQHFFFLKGQLIVATKLKDGEAQSLIEQEIKGLQTQLKEMTEPITRIDTNTAPLTLVT